MFDFLVIYFHSYTILTNMYPERDLTQYTVINFNYMHILQMLFICKEILWNLSIFKPIKKNVKLIYPQVTINDLPVYKKNVEDVNSYNS